MSRSTDAPDSLVARIDACLPQTQCTRCGYPRCRDYAAAVAAGRAGINQCPPGGERTLRALSTLLRRPSVPIDPRFGVYRPRVLAVIDEAVCIGCRKCIDVCPVDAIVGSAKRMHTVLAQECTGCELCLPPCPVDCIALIPWRPASPSDPEYPRAETDRWRARTERRLQRLARGRRRRAATVRSTPTAAPGREKIRADIRADIRAAVARVKARKAGTTGGSRSS